MKTLSTIKSTKSNSAGGSLLSISCMNSAAGTMRVKLLLFQEYQKGLQEVCPPLAKVVTSQLLIRAGWERVLARIRNVSILKQCAIEVSKVFFENGGGEGDSGNAKLLFISFPFLCLLAAGFYCHAAGEPGVETNFRAVLIGMKAFIFVPCIPGSKEDKYKKKPNRETIK